MKRPRYYIAKDNAFVIENYNAAPTFSSFFPGIAGIWGCPMWVFYANRGQCIASAGVYDKNRSIIEFQPANKAYRTLPLTGFRTFIKIGGRIYEPFAEHSPFQNRMRITPYDLTLIEENPKLKIKVEVNYFTVPNDHFPALSRRLKIENLSRRPMKLEIIDGLPAVIPYGFSDDLLKRISQTIAAWCEVKNLENNAPFYKLKLSPADISETQFINKGNFFISFAEEQGKQTAVDLIVDPALVFGENKSFEFPSLFARNKKYKLPASQQTQGFIPAALVFKRAVLRKSEALEIHSLLGQADTLEHLNRIKNEASKKYLEGKRRENCQLIEEICSAVDTRSSSRKFDLYCRQTYLDNIMRGGLATKLGKKLFYLYYRKHGDMERDYNDFKLMPTYFSQGTGNYRDINQNRRSDIFFNPEIGEDNLLRFFNLIQLDGYNPLVVLGSRCWIKSKEAAKSLLQKHLKKSNAGLLEILTVPFLLGSVLKHVEESEIEYRTSREDFARALLENSSTEEEAEHGEGFWTDHFSYNTDLLESFEAIYPERIKDLLLDQRVFTFFDNDHIVVDRSEKYCLAQGEVRQYCAVKSDPEKRALIQSRGLNNHSVKTDNGKGKTYFTTLIAKILCLIANKAASFDAQGIGLEMEADKPDWYDALNGLPALFGSSLSETLELKRLCEYTLKHLPQDSEIILPAELMEFIQELDRELEQSSDSFEYWDKSCEIKEAYRKNTRLGLSGRESKIKGKAARVFLQNVILRCDAGIQKCLRKYKNYFTYFTNQVTDYDQDGGRIRVKSFSQKPLPLFLEGFAHALKVEKEKNIYQLVRKSGLFDKKLNMYKVNSPLDRSPVEIGRARIFTPGWLENESVWLHMEYKYMLELLKAGLYEEFFKDFKKVMIPFLKPEKYKRSTLENSSFLVSSTHPNKEEHGRGFVARLSGATAEFLDMWVIMTTGKKMFYLDNKGKLCFKLSPVLPAWLFHKGEFSFKLLGLIDVTYVNKSKKNTYDGLSPVSYKLLFDGQEAEINNSYLPLPYSKLIRERKIKKIIVTLS